ncbi:54S ribosomal protein L33 [Paramyrothecium foliicola]|nr:54S ribosomal protein L33 [Paramyrothecium foliicola]
MSFFRITLRRSAIGLPERTRGILAALGLRRRMQTVFHPVEPQFAGMIFKVKELVQVKEVDRALTKTEVKAERTPDAGFYVEKAVPRVQRTEAGESISAEAGASTGTRKRHVVLQDV